jgi:hypothetical protein
VALVLRSYFDESGTHRDSTYTVMAAVCANAQQWDRFEARFSRLKRRHNFDILHAKELKHRQGDFTGWTTPERIALMKDLLRLVEDNPFTASVTVTLNNADYEGDYRKGSNDPRLLRTDSRYGLVFRNCLIFLALEGMKRARKGRPPPKMNFIVEAGHKNAGDALRIYDEMRRDLERRNCPMFCGIQFSDKHDCNPLMMADFMAHTTWMMMNAPPGVQAQLFAGQIPFEPQGRRLDVTHLKFKDGGLAELKTALINRLTTRDGFFSRAASEEQSS